MRNSSSNGKSQILDKDSPQNQNGLASPTNKGETAVGPFTSEDFVTPFEIVAKLRSSERVYALIWSKLSETARKLLISSSRQQNDVGAIRALLAHEFNTLVSGAVLYQKEIFPAVPLRKWTFRLLTNPQTQPNPGTVNRLLLEDLFGNSIARRETRGKTEEQELAKIHELKNGRFAVLVYLKRARELNGKTRKAGPQKLGEFASRTKANARCSQINIELCDGKLAPKLSARQLELAEDLYLRVLAAHPGWEDHMPEAVAYLNRIGWRPSDGRVPSVDAAARMYWNEVVVRKTRETQINRRYMLGVLLARFGSGSPAEMTDQALLQLAKGRDQLEVMRCPHKLHQPPEERLDQMWTLRAVSKSVRPWNEPMQDLFLNVARGFKNWMHWSLDPASQEMRNWCQPCLIKLASDDPNGNDGGADADADEEEARRTDPMCVRNPALRIPMVQALLDVSSVAFDGLYLPHYGQVLFCGSRVKESLLTNPSAFRIEDGLLALTRTKTKTDRDVELTMNALVLFGALRALGKLTAESLRPTMAQRRVILVLAGFRVNEQTKPGKRAMRDAEIERARLAKKGIKLTNYNWGIRYPKNAIRRTALSMHYKLFLDESRTTAWGGNTSRIFRKYYKRLVTKAEAKQYWLMLPTWLKKARIPLSLPIDHKLDSVMTKPVKECVSAAIKALRRLYKKAGKIS